MINKFENPVRLLELKPYETLIDIGLKHDSIFCDIGAGSGVFTFEASKITNNNIYAVEISEGLIKILHEKKSKLNLDNVIIENNISNLPSNSCDIIMLCTTLHEIRNIDISDLINEVKRISKKGSITSIIEFHKTKTPMGPPIELRLSEQDVIELMEKNQFKLINKKILGDNLYCCIFEKK